MSNIIEILLMEREILRRELQDLKNCQVRYFSLSIAATGVLFGLGSDLFMENAPTILFLVPLIIILPCWWIFFDKATTITRIVGYTRLLEAIITSLNKTDYYYIGWENALDKFRIERDKIQKGKPLYKKLADKFLNILAGCRILITFKTTHRYWIINWYTFFGIAVLCWTLGNDIVTCSNSLSCIYSIKFFGPGFLILFSTLFNLYLLGNLTDGKFSLRSSYIFWESILKVRSK